jgi:hypothetical protein
MSEVSNVRFPVAAGLKNLVPSRTVARPGGGPVRDAAKQELFVLGPGQAELSSRWAVPSLSDYQGRLPMELILIIIVVVLLFGGGGYWGRRRGHW